MLSGVMHWIAENIEWLFSGIGVTLLLGLAGLVRKRSGKRSRDAGGSRKIKIEQKNEGRSSTQIGIQNNYYGERKDD